MHAQAEVASKEAAIADYKAKIVQDTEAMRRSERQLTAGAEGTSALEAKVASLAEALEKVLHASHLLVHILNLATCKV